MRRDHSKNPIRPRALALGFAKAFHVSGHEELALIDRRQKPEGLDLFKRQRRGL